VSRKKVSPGCLQTMKAPLYKTHNPGGETMGISWNEDLGKLILRFNLGFLMLFHGGETVMGTNNILANTDPVPDFIIWPLAFTSEIVASLLIMAGAYSRIGGFFIAGFMFWAIMLRHTFGDRNHWFDTTRPLVEGLARHGMESQLFFLCCGLAVMFIGAGKYGLNKGGKWN
jgi:putative oxidoreductase